ncbi:MAG: MraY family glycosyltransferase [Planctomycetota bacterium]
MIAAATETTGALDWFDAAAAFGMLWPFWPVLGVSFAVALVLTPVVRGFARRHKIVDVPDLRRKNHAKPVAYLGGLAIFIAWLAGVVVSYLLTPQATAAGYERIMLQSLPVSILVGAGVITLTGLIDDVYGIPARMKIGGQLFAAAALTWDRVAISLTERLFGLVGVVPGESLIYFAATFLVAVFVVGGCNAVNLLDGLDGLAGGVVVIAMTGLLAIAVLAGLNPDIALMKLDSATRLVLSLATVGAVLGFLVYNWNPASIFMGDAGSLLLGFLCVTAVLLFGDLGSWSPKLVTAGLIVLALPITDTSLAIVRRKVRGQPVFSPDNQHLHHLLRRAGLSVKQSVGVMYAAAAGFAVIGVAFVAFEVPWRYSLGFCGLLYLIIMAAAFVYGARCLARDRERKEAVGSGGAEVGRPTGPSGAAVGGS